MDPANALHRAILFVALANLAYFGVELTVALQIRSASLLADSIDFLEDASVNILILIALGWSLAMRARMGYALAGLLLIPGIATLWTVWRQIVDPSIPEPMMLSATGFGALVVNLLCAFVLVRFRNHSGSLTKAAFLSARNDAVANIAIIAAGGLTYLTRSALPDLVVGIGIALMNADAARAVWRAAHREHTESRP